jgi:hypothetical protein
MKQWSSTVTSKKWKVLFQVATSQAVNYSPAQRQLDLVGLVVIKLGLSCAKIRSWQFLGLDASYHGGTRKVGIPINCLSVHTVDVNDNLPDTIGDIIDAVQ